MSQLEIIDWLLSEKAPASNEPLDLNEWKAAFDAAAQTWEDPIERAIVGGWQADCVAFAFAAGYQAALRQLVPDLPVSPYAALCVTESGGNVPRMMKTTLTKDGDHWRLDGEKTFVTHAREAEILLIAAVTGQDERGRNRLRVVSLPADSSGIQITPLPDLPFIPEVSHGTVQLENVLVRNDQILAGDGYDKIVKPFRTVEDLHVFAGIVAYLFRVATQMRWDTALREQCIALLTTLIPLAQDSPDAAYVHIAIGGLQQQMSRFIEALEFAWEQAGGEGWMRWRRDKRLLRVAEDTRKRRLLNAWQAFLE